jgi:ATP-dependent Zn protease
MKPKTAAKNKEDAMKTETAVESELNGSTQRSNELIGLAYHEAGQAVAAWELGQLRERDYITVIPGKKSLWRLTNYRRSDNERFDSLRYEAIAVVCLAGMVAQSRCVQEKGTTFLSGKEDRRRASATLKLAGAFYSEEVRNAHYSYIEKRAEDLIARDWAMVVAVANRLLTEGTLTRDQIYRTCGMALTRQLK